MLATNDSSARNGIDAMVREMNIRRKKWCGRDRKHNVYAQRKCRIIAYDKMINNQKRKNEKGKNRKQMHEATSQKKEKA